jgi:hypothetical protein
MGEFGKFDGDRDRHGSTSAAGGYTDDRYFWGMFRKLDAMLKTGQIT